MIAFDLKCGDDHEFEAWFRDGAAYDSLRKARRVTCPECGSAKIEKALMTPNVAAGRDRDQMRRRAAQHAHQHLKNLREFVEKNADNVGDGFAEEARKIHYGEADSRNIYGNATREESVSLTGEGIEIQKVPWVARDS